MLSRRRTTRSRRTKTTGPEPARGDRSTTRHRSHPGARARATTGSPIRVVKQALDAQRRLSRGGRTAPLVLEDSVRGAWAHSSATRSRPEHAATTNGRNGADAGTLYVQGSARARRRQSTASRAPEMIIPSTAALAEGIRHLRRGGAEHHAEHRQLESACPGVALVDRRQLHGGRHQLPHGKPAHRRSPHAREPDRAGPQADPTTDQGQQIAIATLLDAAHTCE